jgi:hypothetical protein
LEGTRSYDQNFRVVETVIVELRERDKALAQESKTAASRSATGSDAETEIGAALDFAERLSELVSSGKDFALATDAFSLANAKLFVKFKPILKKRRVLNQIVGGVVTLGTAAPPIGRYEGPTSRDKTKMTSPKAATAVEEPTERRSPTSSEVNVVRKCQSG